MKIAMFVLPAYAHVTQILQLTKSLIEEGHDIVMFTSRRHEAMLAEVGCDTIVDAVDVYQSNSKLQKEPVWGTQFMLRSAEKVYPVWREYLIQMECDLMIADLQLIPPKLLAKDLKLPFVIYSGKGQLGFKRLPVRQKHLYQWLCKPLSFLSFLYDIWNIPRRMQKKFSLEPFTIRTLFLVNDCDIFLSVLPPCLFGDLERLPEYWYFLRPDIASRKIAQRHSTQHCDIPWQSLSRNKCIYVSMGTVFNSSASNFDVLLQSLKDFDAEVVVSAPSSVHISLPSNPLCRYHVVSFAPQIEILRLTDVFVSHCGSNSVIEAVHFGVPIVGIPQAADQFANAERMNRLELGINLNGMVSVENTRSAVLEMLEKPRERHRMDIKAALTPHPREINEQQAIELIENLVASHRKTALT